MGLTQDEVGKAIGVQRAAVSNWERALNEPTDENLRALSRIYSVSEKWLRTGSESPQLPGPDGKALGGRKRLPLAARVRLNEYSTRLKAIGMNENDIDYFEDLILGFTQYHVAGPGPQTDEDWVKEVDAGWAAVEHYLTGKGYKP